MGGTDDPANESDQRLTRALKTVGREGVELPVIDRIARRRHSGKP